MKKYILLLVILISVGLVFIGCSQSGIVPANNEEDTEQSNEDTNQQEEDNTENDDHQVGEEGDKAGEQDKDEEDRAQNDVEEVYNSLDSDILYHYMDGDADFLLMKLGDLPLVESEEGKYYELTDAYSGHKTLYWLAEDDYTINRISVVKKLDHYNSEEGDPLAEGYPMRFMGIWLDMPLEDAEKSVTNIPTWNSDQFNLRVEYSDYEDDGKVYRIDVYSNKLIGIDEHKEDFYLKWFGCNIEEESDHLGFGPFDTPTPIIDESNRIYTYEMEFGPDGWSKHYYYDENKLIASVRISTELGSEFQATVPSILGIRLNMDADEINSFIQNAGNTINYENSYNSTEGEFITREYVVTNNKTDIMYNLEINIHLANNLVGSIKVTPKPAVAFSEDYSLDLISENIKDVEDQLFRGGDKEIDEANRIYRTNYDFVDSGDKWTKEYYYNEDSTIFKVKLSLGSNGQVYEYVPSLFGIKLKMDQRAVENAIKNNNYSIGRVDPIQDTDDGKYYIKGYMLYHNKTNYAYNIELIISNETELIEGIEVYRWAP